MNFLCMFHHSSHIILVLYDMGTHMVPTSSGWWFGTCFIFPYIGKNHSSQLTFIFFRGVGQPPTSHSGDASALLLHLMSSPVPGVLLHRGQAPRLPAAAARGAPGVPPWALEL